MNRARFLKEAEAEFLQEVQYYADVGGSMEPSGFAWQLREAGWFGQRSPWLASLIVSGHGEVFERLPILSGVSTESGGHRNSSRSA